MDFFPQERDEIRREDLGPALTDMPDFPDWLAAVSPRWHWHWPHLRLIQAHLDRVTRGDCKRLMLFLPPRHGKSEQATIRYPVWRLEQRPETRVCIGCYNQQFAERFGRRSRQLAERRGLLAKDRTAAKEWETQGGGVYRSCGVGSAPMGEGFDLIVIDDPVKSREEAESEAYRERAWEWYGDLFTRREPGCALVLIQTRWHEDDLAGRLLKAQGEGGDTWEVVSLPALAEEGDPLGRSEGEALCPERFDAAELLQTKAVLGSYGFAALYQQRPGPREGGFFQRAWFDVVPAASAAGFRVRCWDFAATADGGDYTCGVRMCRSPEGVFFVEDVIRGQWGPGDRDRIILQTAAADGKAVRVQLEQEPGSGGKTMALAVIRLLAGYPVQAEPSTGTKETRADPLAAQAQAGNVKLVAGDWLKPFLEELCSFPHGAHDDQVDAASGAFAKLTTAYRYEFT